MSVKIGSNATSLNVQRNLGDAALCLSKSMERLSSGLRINRASDDAAGLSISETLKSSSRVFATAIRNVNDGVSFLNIADSAMGELANISTRQIELAEQAINGSYSKVQRQALNSEADALAKEFNRIVRTTEFNKIKVIDVEESSGLIRIQAGYGVTGSLGLSLGQELSRYVGTGEFGMGVGYSTEGIASYGLQLADIDGDGDLDMVTAGYGVTGGRATVKKNNGDGTFGIAVQYTTERMRSYAVQLADIDGDGDLDMITAGYGSGGGMNTIRKNSGNGTFGAAIQYSTGGMFSYDIKLVDIDQDGDLDMISTGLSNEGKGEIAIRKNNGDGSFGAVIHYSAEEIYSKALELADIDGDGDLDMITAGQGIDEGEATIRRNNGSGLFGDAERYSTEFYGSFALQLSDIDDDGDLDLITGGNGGATGYASIRKNLGDGTFGKSVQYSTETNGSNAIKFADIDGDGSLDMVTAGYAGYGSGGKVTIRRNVGDGTFLSALQYSTEAFGSFALQVADLDRDGVLDIVTAGDDNRAGSNVRLGRGHDVTTIASINLCTQSGAREALTTLKAQLGRISAERGDVGSAQSRLSVALNTLSATKENFDAASSRITDVDVAQEAAYMTRTEIIEQAAASILASANQAPQIALTLLKG